MMAFASLLAQCVWAEQVATWRDFSPVKDATSQVVLNSMEGATYKLTIPTGNTVADDGALVIGSTGGLTINYSNTAVVTIELDVADIPTSDIALFTAHLGTTHGISLGSNNGTLTQRWLQNWGAYNTGSIATTGRHTVAMTYYGADKSASNYGTQTYVDGASAIARSTSLISTGTNITEIRIGAKNATQLTATGMKIYAIRLYNSRLSDSDISTAYTAHKLEATFSAETANRTASNDELSAFKTTEKTYDFKSAGEYYNTVNFGANGSSQFKSHLVFEGALNKLTHGSGSPTLAMSTTGTLSDPAIYVKSGTLDYTMKDMNGWNGARVDTSVVRVADGATLNFLPNSNDSMFMSGRLVLEPGSTTTYKTGTNANGFCVYGGAPNAANAVKAQIYVPAPTGNAKVASFAKADGSQKNFKFGVASGTGGAAITVEDGATLEFNSPIEGAQNFSKYGAGTLKLMQAVTSSGYTGTATINAGTIEFASGENSMKLAQRAMEGLLQVDKGATYTAQAGDVPNYGTAGSVAVYGTLDMANYRWTMGTANKTYVYAGGLIKGAGDGNGSILDFYQNGATIYGKKFDGVTEQVGEISGPLNLQQDVTFDVEDGMTLKISGQKRFPNQKSFTKSGSGTLELSGEWQGGTGNFYNLTISGGTISYNLGEGNERSLCINSFSNSGKVKVLSGTLYREVTTRDLSGLNLGTIECAEGAAFELRAVAQPAECGAGIVNFTNIPEGITLKVVVGAETKTVERQSDGTGSIAVENIIGGPACLYDIVFNHLADATHSQNGTFDYKAVSNGTLKYDTEPTFSQLDGGQATAGTGAYIKHHPYIDGAATIFSGLTDFTTVLVGTMSATANTQFIHFGSCDGTKPGLMLATTGNKDEVAVVRNTGTTLKEITTLSVPNSATSRHVYVITKHDTDTESIFEIWLDGIRRATVPLGEKFTLGTSGHSGVQVGSSFGGSLNNGTYKAVANNDSEAGVINVLRVYNYQVSKAQIDALSAAYPYVPQGVYTRDVTGTVNFSADHSWAKAPSTVLDQTVPAADEEGNAPSAIITATGSATITINATVGLETLTLQGEATAFASGEGKVTPGTLVVKNATSLKLTQVDISNAVVSLGTGATLAIDMSDYEVPQVMQTTLVPVTGETEANDGISVTLPTNIPDHRHVEKVFEGNRYQLKITVDMVTIDLPTVEHATPTAVVASGVVLTITDNQVAAPFDSDLTVTYTAETGWNLNSGNTISATGVTTGTTLESTIVAAKNVYTVAVTQVDNAVATVKIGDDDAFVCTATTVNVEHGKTFVATYTAAQGYMITSGNTEYRYTGVSQNFTTPYETTFVVSQIKAKVDGTNYASLADALAVEGVTSITLCADVAEDIALTQDIEIVVPQNCAITGTISGEFTLSKSGSGELTLNNGTSGAAINASTLKIAAGTVKLNLGNGDAKVVDAKFIVCNGAMLTNYGWVYTDGTLTIENADTASVFNGACFRPSSEGGLTKIVKKGAGTLTLNAWYANNATSGSAIAFPDTCAIEIHDGQLSFVDHNGLAVNSQITLKNEGAAVYSPNTITSVITDVVGKNVVQDTESGIYSLATKTFTITITPVANTTVIVDGAASTAASITVDYGTDHTIVYTADENYKLSGEGSFSLTNVTADQTVGADLSAVLDVTTITIPAAPANTTVKVTVDDTEVAVENNSITATIGATVVVTYTADEGYEPETTTTEFTAAAGTQPTINVPTNVKPIRPTAPVATVTTLVKEGLDAAYTFTMDANESEATSEYYGDWDADFVVTFDKDVAAGSLKLSGQYDGNGPDWADLTIGDVTAGTEIRLISMVAAQLGYEGLTVPYSMIRDSVKVFNCGVTNLDGNAGTKMTVKLVLSKDGETLVIGEPVVYTLVGTIVIPEESMITEGELVVPAPEGTETIEIDGEVVESAKVPLDQTQVYTVTAKNANGEVIAESQIGVINAKSEETSTAKTTVVAVPFEGATVANLLNTALLSDNDTLTAYVGGSYRIWKLTGGAWVGEQMSDKEGTHEGLPATTALARGSAVWVTTSCKIVVVGKYVDSTVAALPTSKETHLLANPMMTPYTPQVSNDDTKDQIVTIEATPVRYTKKVDNKGNVSWTAPVKVREFMGKPVYEDRDATPSIPVGTSFWFIKK